jgi:hypothetical protein
MLMFVVESEGGWAGKATQLVDRAKRKGPEWENLARQQQNINLEKQEENLVFVVWLWQGYPTSFYIYLALKMYSNSKFTDNYRFVLATWFCKITLW